MIRLLAVYLAVGLLAGASAATQSPPTFLPAPAAPGAMGSSLTQGPDGRIYLSWLEPAGGEAWALRFSRFDAARQRWGEARTIAQGTDWFINWADFPVLAVQEDRMTAVWFVNSPAGGHGHHAESYRAFHSTSTNQGTSWSPPEPVTRESESVEFVALQPMPDGRLLAAWLDGRASQEGHERQTLYARVLGAPGPDQLVDGFVCDCCQLSFVPTPEGGALLAYRGRTPAEVRDMQLARFDGQGWARPVTLHADGWKITGCPVNGPQLTIAGQALGAVWFTAADNQPRVLARVSGDAGKSFGPVVRLDLGRPQGRVDSVMLADGTCAILWLEAAGQTGGVYLRTIGPDGHLSAARLLAPSSGSRMSGFPRMIRSGPRQLLVTCTQDTVPTSVLTFTVGLD